MKRFLSSCLLVCSGMTMLALSLPAKQAPNAEATSHESKATVEGLVRDIACLPFKTSKQVADIH
jgi:hypothetical protein